MVSRWLQKLSDHKPVHSLFEVQVKRTIEDKKEAVMRGVCICGHTRRVSRISARNLFCVALLRRGCRGVQVSRDVMRRLDEMENRTLPRLSLSNPIITFGNAYYRVPKTDRLTIKNIGAVSDLCSSPVASLGAPNASARILPCRYWRFLVLLLCIHAWGLVFAGGGRLRAWPVSCT